MFVHEEHFNLVITGAGADEQIGNGDRPRVHDGRVTSQGGKGSESV